MAETLKLHHPWLVAAWPGMGQVALNAGVYLLAKLGMSVIAEFEASVLFDVEYVEVKDGVIQTGRSPRNRLFLWRDPAKRHDLVVFLGEAQPPVGKYTFCRQLVEHVRRLGVERVFTFAAMATPMHPAQPSRLFAAATDRQTLQELQRYGYGLEILEDGQIGGLNGVLLAAVAEEGLHGACLLGEMPQLFSQLPFPKASLAILELFGAIARIDLDTSELAEQSQVMEGRLIELLNQMEKAYRSQQSAEEDTYAPEPAEPNDLDPDDVERIEALFDQAVKNRSKAFELKQELDRLDVFKDYEDRFLDLFRRA